MWATSSNWSHGRLSFHAPSSYQGSLCYRKHHNAVALEILNISDALTSSAQQSLQEVLA